MKALRSTRSVHRWRLHKAFTGCAALFLASLWGGVAFFTVRPWTAAEAPQVYELVKRVQRRRDANFNCEGPEEDDCTWQAGYFGGHEGQLFVAVDNNAGKVLGSGAVVLGTQVSSRQSGASESRAGSAAIRRVCAEGGENSEELLQALLKEAGAFARAGGAENIIALAYEGGSGCQPTPLMLQRLGYIAGSALPGCPDVLQYSLEVAAGEEPAMERSDFSGRWKMDLKSSDSLKSVLGALGMNWIVIQLVDRLGVQQEVTQSDDSLRVTVKTAVRTDNFELPFDRSVTVVPGASGGENPQTSAWVKPPSGGAMWLRTRQAVEGALDRPDEALLFETVRSLGDGGSTIFEDVAVIRRGVREASARRVLRKLQ